MKLLVCLFLILFFYCIAADTLVKRSGYSDDEDGVFNNLKVNEHLSVGDGPNEVAINNGEITVGGHPFRGRTGPRGHRGKKGEQGERGYTGEAGPPGPAGEQGPQGERGKTGPRGGRGNERTRIDSVTGVNGVITTVCVRNPKSFVVGQQVYASGVGYFIVKSIDDDSKTFKLKFVSAGTGYTGTLKAGDLLVSVGAPGPVGSVGPAGPQGPKGERGSRGKRGFQGLTGRDGRTGETGPVGPAGPQGPEGPVGPVGPQGPEGPQGPAGSQGPVGPVGPVGPQGNQGNRGNPGPRGFQGPEGPQGPQGDQGPAGPAGPQGPKGEPFSFTKSHETYHYMLPSICTNTGRHPDFPYYASTDTSDNFNIFSNLYVKFANEPVAPPQHNRNLNESRVETFTKSCAANQVLVDSKCYWNTFKYVKKPTWCRASDFIPVHEDCTDCVKSVDKTKKRFFDGQRDVTVVRRLTFADAERRLQSIALNGYSCKTVHLYELSDFEVSNCGFFCFFHDVEEVHVDDHSFTCRYVPPKNLVNSIGIAVPADAEEKFEGKVAVVTLQITCQNL